jgi:hypothetical protein
MKLIPVIAAFALATLLACGSDNKIYTLSSGTYNLSNTSAVAPDNCNLGQVFHDNTSINLTVTASSVTFVLGPVPNAARDPVATLQGNTIGTGSKTYDFDNSPRYDCIETITLAVTSGSLLANDQLNATITYSTIRKSGAACTAQNLQYKVFPCSSTETFIAKKM